MILSMVREEKCEEKRNVFKSLDGIAQERTEEERTVDKRSALEREVL